MIRSLIAVAVLAASALSVDVAAAQSAPGVDARQHHQAGRIHSGIRDGSLTLRETGRLIRGQAGLRRTERRFGRDGTFTPRERGRLHRGLNRQGRRIFRGRRN